LLLLLPIRTDSPVRRPPRINHLLIALNVVCFLVTDVLGDALGGGYGSELKQRCLLSMDSPAPWQFITYQFLHGDVFHLLGNLLFLWVFGNSVNSKLGDIPYLLFYLAGGAFAGAGFSVFSHGNLIGASGAIASVTTAYLVLFPQSKITVFYWLWLYIGTMHVRALLLIGLKIILWDNILSPRLSGGQGVSAVAYSAHIAGYLFGFTVCALLLLLRAVPRDQYDVLALIKRYRLRQQYKAMMADPNARAQAMYGRVARPVSADTGEPIEDDAPDDELSRLRAQIGERLTQGDYMTAVNLYEGLIAKDPKQCLGRNQMLLLANQLMTLQRHPQAAGAYEKLLKEFPGGNDLPQIKLVLGIIYARYLGRLDTALAYLRDCEPELTDPEQLAQARHWLAAAQAAQKSGGRVYTDGPRQPPE